MFWIKDIVQFYCVIISFRRNMHNGSCIISSGLSDALIIFPISLIAFEKMRKIMFWKKDTVSFCCIVIIHRTNIHNDSCRV